MISPHLPSCPFLPSSYRLLSHSLLSSSLPSCFLSSPPFLPSSRVRFLFGGRHGEFKFLPPPGYAPCYEAVLPREKLTVEHSQEYKQDLSGTRDLLGPTLTLSQAAFTPTPVDTSQVSFGHFLL